MYNHSDAFINKLGISYSTPAEEYAAVYEELQHCRETCQGQAAGILEARLRALGEGLITPLPATRGRMVATRPRPRRMAQFERPLWWWRLRWSR